ncbi:deoxyguanosinetriphosphate triphosphohydrolase [Candidatus Peregrinibacteria bacterium CG_4_9_14_0_2_um_filter_53_11]|nr:MAG: deoxyguanosinetriphosphate triphosphohydrolase [Candidatus Peregrinibacteria bacterium CG_4_9_14_0_2_um_filter_53_11]
MVVPMIFGKKELELHEQKTLAPYAVLSMHSRGRTYLEPIDETRTEFQRDRDRIIHSKAFRRLSGKTQVFIAKYQDHTRDRLSHSLEVAQVARDLARSLGLNEDLCEAVALAHDLGHTPFGHSGEEELNSIMQKFGGHFEHNEQSKRIVEQLEQAFSEFNGLNLAHETLDAMAKHQSLYDQKTKKIRGKTLEAQVVDKADEIAYHNHDLDDGLRAGLFTIDDLLELKLVQEAYKIVVAKHGDDIPEAILHSRLISQSMSLMIGDLISSTKNLLASSSITTLAHVIDHEQDLVDFSPELTPHIQELRTFLWERMYQSPKVLTMMHHGQEILHTVFDYYYTNPKELPEKFGGSIDTNEPLEVVVKDYIAGMTDTFITSIYALSKM